MDRQLMTPTLPLNLAAIASMKQIVTSTISSGRSPAKFHTVLSIIHQTPDLLATKKRDALNSAMF